MVGEAFAPGLLLAELGLLADPDLVDVARLAGGYANEVWRVRGAALDLVVKRFRDSNVGGLYGNAHELEALALERLSGTGIAPELVAHVPERAVVVYAHVAGAPWTDDVEPVARMLARLHERDGVGFPTLTTAPRSLLLEGDAFATRCSRGLRERVLSARPLPVEEPEVRRRLVHRDCGPGNVIVGERGPVLIDWQCPGLGDPVEDLCGFLSPACQVLYGRSPLPSWAQERFLAAYPDAIVRARFHVLREFYDYRMLGYCAWRSEALASTRPADASTYRRAVRALLA